MTYYTDLKARAEAAKANPGEWFDGDHWQLREGDLADVDLAFIGAASPDVILALIAENERLRTLLRETRDYAGQVEQLAAVYLLTRHKQLPDGAKELGERIATALQEGEPA